MPDPNASSNETVVRHRATEVSADAVAQLADRLHDARKLLFLLLHSQWPVATGNKALPNESLADLWSRLDQV